MKKYLIMLSTAFTLAIFCSFAFNAYAAEDISNAEVTLSQTGYTYSGEAIEPEVNVSISRVDSLTGDTVSETLVKNTDYTVSYADNIDAGTASVTVSGIGSYSGTASANFVINPQKITSSGVTFKNTSRAYPNVAPEYTVSYNSDILKQGVDYKISVKNYAKVGVKSATVTFSGIGNFTGTKSIGVNVYPNKVTSFSTKNRTTNSFDLSWKSQESLGVTGYKVYTCDSKGNNTKLYKTVDKNTCSVTKRSAGQYYYFKVRAYKTSDDTTIYSEYSSVFKTCAKPAKVTLKSVTKSKDGKTLKIKWAKAGCTAYEVQYTTDKDFKKGVKTKIVSSDKTSASFAIAKSNKLYYARIRAYRQYNSGKVRVNGAWSSKLSTSYSKLYATYTTSYVNNPKRTNNLKIASKAINGTIVYPGEVFSFNKTVGKRTTAKGYKEAYVFTGPNSHTMGVGGGVCQVASTMFNAALLANLKIVERHQHSQRVAYCPLGRDAAIYWGSEDFKFKNTTNYPIKIKMTCKNGKITCSYYVCYDVSPKKVKISVSRKGNRFTLKRSVGGKVNYTAKSTY